MKYLIVIEETRTGYSAYSTDVEGSVATGETREVAAMAMKGSLDFQIEGLKEERREIPKPRTFTEYLDVSP